VTAPRAGEQPLDQSVVLLATVDTLPWPYEILGLLETAMSAGTGIVPTARLIARVPDHELAWGADAVIGTRLSQFTMPGASQVFRARLFGRENLVVAIAIGTAVRQLPGEDAGRHRRHGLTEHAAACRTRATALASPAGSLMNSWAASASASFPPPPEHQPPGGATRSGMPAGFARPPHAEGDVRPQRALPRQEIRPNKVIGEYDRRGA